MIELSKKAEEIIPVYVAEGLVQMAILRERVAGTKHRIRFSMPGKPDTTAVIYRDVVLYSTNDGSNIIDLWHVDLHEEWIGIIPFSPMEKAPLN